MSMCGWALLELFFICWSNWCTVHNNNDYVDRFRRLFACRNMSTRIWGYLLVGVYFTVNNTKWDWFIPDFILECCYYMGQNHCASWTVLKFIEALKNPFLLLIVNDKNSDWAYYGAECEHRLTTDLKLKPVVLLFLYYDKRSEIFENSNEIVFSVLITYLAIK